ncbi:DUF1254 domain-containing protein [Dasania marina]|uniref:DUF1254 domain-containing protein n=1 Tax=Dasania marina TaxID=471499 RepID=UPI0004B5B9AB|nr:DUF1254 domain-containing protein [Dasania marina]
MNDLNVLARDAYIWGIPLVQTRLYLQLAKELKLPFNQLFVSSDLSTPDSDVPLPNVDTLYGLGWLDLSNNPIIVSVPETDDRYYLIQLNDAYLNSFCYLGRRTTGTHACEYAIVGPNWTGSLPEHVIPITAPTNHVLVLTRVLVNTIDDLPLAQAVQNAFSLTDLSSYPTFTNPARPIDDAFNNFPILQPSKLGVHFFDELCAGLAENPPPVSDHNFVSSLEQLGIAAGKKPSQEASSKIQQILAQAAIDAHAIIHGRGGWLIDTRNVNGWMVSYGITSFIKDPLDRAVVAKLGPGCLVPEEGLYFSMLEGPDNKPLTGDKNYTLEFPAGGLPPVDAFWSLTLYNQDWALASNPIDRYAIGDRTEGLKFEPDGSLKIFIQHQQPTEGTFNWLPTPKEGWFHLFLRTYQPKQNLSNGSYAMPPLKLEG